MSPGSAAEVAAQPFPSQMATTTSSPPDSGLVSRLSNLRGVRWRINLCGLRSFSIDDLRHVTANSRRRYAASRRRLLIDPHITRHGHRSPDPVVDNPLSENPDSMWSRFFRNAELEKMVDQDLSRLYPEHGSYFQTSGCQSMLRRILLLWCLGHPEYGYRQGMHELLAPLLYVLHADLHRLSEVQKLYEDHFTDKFDDTLFQEHDLSYSLDFNKSPDFIEDSHTDQEKRRKAVSLDELDQDIQTIILLSDAYGAEGELGVVLSEKFVEHDVYSMFDALMSGAGGSVAMAEFFNPSPGVGTQTGLPPVIEASSALYHLLSIVDPSLYSHLIEIGVEPQYFALRWLRVLFGREFSLEDLLVIWDEIFSYDNAKLVKADEDDDLRSSSGVLNSERGSFISAMAVSMILILRSSLLATETATFCLQRLLNFPENIDLEKLIGKAKSLLPVALDANSSSSSIAVSGSYNVIKSKVIRGHSQSMDSGCLNNPISSVPESYWEDKWRNLHKEEEEEELRKEKISSSQSLTPKKSWTHKVKLRLSRTESVPSSSKRDSNYQDHPPSVRRNLLHDLARQLGEDAENIGESEPLTQEDPVNGEATLRFLDDDPENLVEIKKTHSEQTAASEENSAIFSDPPSPVRELGNDSDKSSFASNTPSQDMNNEARQSIFTLNSNLEDRSASVSDRSEVSAASSVSDSSQKALTGSKDKKSFSGRFQWLWKLGRHGSAEGTSCDKGADINASKSANGDSYQDNVVARSFDEDHSCSNPTNVKVDVNDQNVIHTLRSLGHSMLENIQVIESVFEQDTCQAGSVDNLSKSAIVERGQVRAISALKELRKISNVLSEI